MGPVRLNDTEDGVTGWLKVAVGAVVTATAVAPLAGVVDVTVGATWVPVGTKLTSTQ